MEMVRMAKNGERKFVCKECGKGFKTSATLTMHSNVHTKQRIFVCDVEYCEKSYTRRSDLRRHKEVVHDGSSHECPQCGMSFGQKNTLKQHCKTIHEKKKDYKCVACGVQFVQNYQLVRHTKSVHEKIKDFKCEQCNQSFSEAGNRKKHMQKVHTNNSHPCTRSDCKHTRHGHIKDDKAQKDNLKKLKLEPKLLQNIEEEDFVGSFEDP